MKPSSRRQLMALLVLAFLLRLGAGWVWQARIGDAFAMGDSESYWQLGKTIARGQPYEYGDSRARIFRTPGYPLLLAPIFLVTDNRHTAMLLARAEAALLGTLAVLGVWWLTKILFDERAALLAALLATLYPGAIVASFLVLSEAPFCPLLLLQLAFWALAWKTPSKGRRVFWSLAAGIAAGAATLMRPSWLLFTPFAVGIGIAVGAIADWRSDRRPLASGYLAERFEDRLFVRHLGIAVFMMLGLVVAMLPWWIRNASVTGHFVPTTLQVGASLYDGLNPEATGASNMDFVPRLEAEHRRAVGHRETEEMQLDRYMRDVSLTWARANPGRVLQLVGVKFLRMWNIWPNEPKFAASWTVRLGVFFTYTPLLILAIIGACRTVGRGWPYILCWLPAVYLTLLHVVFVSSIRYRDPAMLALLALAAGAGVVWRNRGV